MNPRLGLLQPYPFDRLRQLLAGVSPPEGLTPISLGLGEPQHPTPPLIKQAVSANLGGLARYPLTAGQPELRAAIAEWIARRHGLAPLDPATQVIPVNGTKEALFSIAQAILDPSESDALVVCPNPFYQIYEGATLLGGARPYFINALAANGLRPDWSGVPAGVWKRDAPRVHLLAQQPHGASWGWRSGSSSSSSPIATASSSSPTSATARSTSTRRSRRSARSPPPPRSGATASRASSRWDRCRSARAPRGCAPDSRPATARSSSASCSIAPTTAPR